MKTTVKQNGMWPAVLMAFMLIVTFSCSKDSDPVDGDKPEPISGEEAEKINSYVVNLNYDPDELLNVQSNTGSSSEVISNQSNTSNGKTTTCKVNEYDIRSNFEDVAIFDPALGVVYPGALVIGNQEMLDGAPQPLQITRAPATLRLDLPGIGESGNIEVANPTYQNVQSSIDGGLEYWNNDIAPQGYEIASRAYYESTTTYSSEQMSLDLGVSAEWVSGSSFESQFSYDTSTSKRVAAILYRQVFYDISMVTPDQPSDVFGSDVDLAKVESLMGSSTPPAYVSSVSYGRIIMIRMETTSTETSVALEAALEYASLGKNVEADIEGKYKSILEQSTINVVTIGGNAKIASQVITGSDVASSGGLNYVITEGSLYSRDNPGAPIAYTVKYLKDNRVAKMGYNTDYRLESCETSDYVHKNASLKKTIGVDVQFRFAYKKGSSQTVKYTSYKKVNDKNVFFSSSPPDGAYDVKIQFQYWDLVWKTLGEQNLNYLSSEKCYEAYCSKTFLGLCTEYTFKSVSCN
ncbi:thiol-activated cytolysin family protein [Maribacter sp. TH_r10]|uniref:thiol-activated cytolysin family protein n=1 Tax=Maribacter sp. TH_r10 TaxID=3082086 RepID=UPI002955D0C6|nr:thiol-activated cytolysin family protein [Maribacter sp. TH_r10]MDV7138717.1 thiol-activated cytolysin family protein [Maribacter sp. TH_r10]|tara:strand:+ start:269 stop:1828 length:1560 start_codon:yes stop_codon:yes gene_type:complete